MGLFSGKLMSDRKAKKMADAQAMLDAVTAAHPEALGSLPGANADDADWQAFAAEDMAERKTIENLSKRGVEAPAVMHSMRPTDETDVSGNRMFVFDVSIQLASGESHKTQISQHMAPFQLEGLADGGPMTVKYDPDDPDNAMLIGW